MNLKGLKSVRFSFADQHGVLRGKTLAVSAVAEAMKRGVGFPGSLVLKDTSHRTVYPTFTPGGGIGMPEMQGAADLLMMPDQSTFRVLPWAPDTGWVLCDLQFADGRAVPFCTRNLFKETLKKLAPRQFIAGLEVEFHVFRIKDPRLQPEDAGQPARPPDVELLTTGYQLLTENKYDQLDPFIQILGPQLEQLQLPLRSFEVEFGPSQLELTLDAMPGLAAADAMVLLRSAVKQVARRHGYHATFMCRPKLPNVMSSGWHLHQSLFDKKNLFTSEKEDLSDLGKQWLAGLLAHARGASAFATPTVNGYKRYRPYSLAPDRVTWGKQNRGALLRLVGGPKDPGTRIENRIGEPAANPYLYFASQIHSGLDGIERKLAPPRAADTPYEAKAEMLPGTLAEALHCLREDRVLVESFGKPFVDYYCRIKEAEIARFDLEVSDWEHREYFDLF